MPARVGYPIMVALTSLARRRVRAAVLAIPLLLSACSTSGAGRSASPTQPTPPSVDAQPAVTVAAETVDQVAASPVEQPPSGLDAARGADVIGLPAPAIALDDLRAGGPPPDGIPPIDEPRFLRAGSVDFLADAEPVLALEVGGEARAYPVQVLIWHEIVNDTVGGIPVAVTYCPLCNSALAYDRRVAGRVLSFGTSGLLLNSSLVMYDRQTETLWSHFTGSGIVGVLTGAELATFPVATVPWRVWRDAHPDGRVLSRQTGFERTYGTNPYPGYDGETNVPFLYDGEVDGRLSAMTRIVGIEDDGAAVAVPLARLREQRVVTTALDGRELSVWWQAGTASALDTDSIAGGADVGATGVFVPVVDGRRLSFGPEGDGFVDGETGSTWNLLGEAVSGALRGRRLESVAHVDTFWFAWAAFRPDTVLALP